MRMHEKTNRDNKNNYRPYYDRKKKIWRVEFPDRDMEEGSLQYVASEFARTGLYYPYHDSGIKEKDYCGHAHEFDGIIEALLDDPEGFSIEGFESYYSEQERKMLQAIQEKLRASYYEMDRNELCREDI